MLLLSLNLNVIPHPFSLSKFQLYIETQDNFEGYIEDSIFSIILGPSVTVLSKALLSVFTTTTNCYLHEQIQTTLTNL